MNTGWDMSRESQQRICDQFPDFLQPLFQAVLLTCVSARSIEKAAETYGAEEESCSSWRPGESF